MRQVGYHKQPEYGLSIEDTLAAGDLVGVEHLTRYWWVWQQLRGLGLEHIWDLGCGCGYGARIIAESNSARVLAVDADPRAIQAASGSYGQVLNLGIKKIDIEADWDLLKEQPKPDAVVLFDTLEMVKHRDVFLDRLVRTVKGPVYLSASFATTTRFEVNPGNAHCRYDREALLNVLTNHFDHVQFLDCDGDDERMALFNQVSAAVREAKPYDAFPMERSVVRCD